MNREKVACKFNVLWLEDDLGAIEGQIKEMQDKLDMKIYCATSYSRALSLLEEMTFDLFILDIELEEDRFTGLQLADLLRSKVIYAATPILFVSIYTHFAYRIVEKYKNCSFVSKPIQSDEIVLQCGVMLNLDSYLFRYYQKASFLIPVSKNMQIEVSSNNVSYIEINNGWLSIQYMEGIRETFACNSGAFKVFLQQIKQDNKCQLKQIHRSIVVNVDQIKKIEMKKNVGFVWLFNDNRPKPIGIRFREVVIELLKYGGSIFYES